MTKYSSKLLAWLECQKCPLGERAYKHVIGRGEMPCDILLIGEAPGKSEEIIGEAFVGPAGRLLEKALEESAGIKFFANLLACRPCDVAKGPNRAPNAFEVKECWPRLKLTVETADPGGVVLLGRVPSAFWDAQHGEEIFRGPVLRTMHPAALLRRGGVNADGWNEYVQGLHEFCKEVTRGR